mgnify:FL=1
MKKMLMAAALLAAAGAGVIATAQDVTKVAPDSYKVEFENDQIRIIRVKRGPHSKVPMHSHPDYVLMMITDIDQKVTTPDGKVAEAHRKAGEVAFSKGLTHAEESLSDKPLEVVLVELKTPAKQ